MTKLESIVPPLELCCRIPEGEFADSALVRTSDCGKTQQYIEMRETVEFCRRNVVNPPRMFPAPTLAEILAESEAHDAKHVDAADFVFIRADWGNTWRVTNGVDAVSGETNPAAAALRLWFRIKKIEVK